MPESTAEPVLPSGEPMNGPEVAARASVFGLLAIGAHQLFKATTGAITAAGTHVSPGAVTPWLRPWLYENDGLEVPLVTATVFALVGLAFVLSLAPGAFRRVLVRPVRWVVALGVGYDLSSVSFSEFESVPSMAWLPVAAGGAAAVGLAWGVTRFSQRLKPLGWLALAVLVVAMFYVTVASSGWASADYAYYLAPAAALRSGLRLGTFYMQYSLIGTLAFLAMITAHLELQQMLVATGFIFALGIGALLAQARHILRTPLMFAAFTISLVAVRILAIRDGPVHVPQVSVWRFELWVALVWVVRRHGAASRAAALVVTLLYLADSFIGALSIGLWAVIATWQALDARSQGSRLDRRTLAILVGLPLGAVALVTLLTGSPVAASGLHYASLKPGFLPISVQSMYWALLTLALVSLSWLARRSNPTRFVDTLLVFIAIAHSIYFFGRSHEHNLLNLSSIWLLVAFVALDRLPTPRLSALAALVLAVLAVCLSWGRGANTCTQAWAMLTSSPMLPLTQRHPVDLRVDAWATVRQVKAPIAFWSRYDGYLNSRLGVAYRPPTSPFYAWVYPDELATWLIKEHAEGTRFFTAEPEWVGGEAAEISQRSGVLASAKLSLQMNTSPEGWGEVVLVPRE